MTRGIHVDNLDPEQADAILTGLQRRVERPVFKKSVKVDKPVSKKPRSWYVFLMQIIVYLSAYALLGLGWLMKHLGEGIYILGEQMKNAARNID